MLEVKNLVKIYKTKGGVVTKALDDVSIKFPENGMIFLLGKSGSGKSTMLNMIGGLDKPDSGEIIIKGKSSKTFSGNDFDSYRNTFVGFIFQEYNILNEFNVEQNISLALQLQGKPNDINAVNKLLDEVDLKGFNKRKPNTLSGGQKQRIAIARALIKEPQIIMADEPTGALDSNTGKQVLDTLKKLSKNHLVIIVSHDIDFAEKYGDRIIELKDGKVISDNSKVSKEASALSSNVKLIGANTVSISEASTLSEAEFRAVYDLIKRQKGEVIVSTGKTNVDNVKKACNISETGTTDSFVETTEVKQKDYKESDVKLIRSKLPFKRAFKMGASGLKYKPLRLILTILLCTCSFAMFGISSTLMMYDPNYSISKALQASPNDSEIIRKEYKFVSHEKHINNETGKITESSYNGYRDTLFGVNEIKELNNSNVGHKFAGVIANNNNNYSAEIIDTVVNGEEKYYNTNKIVGFIDAGEEYLNNNQMSIIVGSYPTEENEILITDFLFNVIKNDNNNNIKDYIDIVGDTYKLNLQGQTDNAQATFTITGVVNVGKIPDKFNPLKNMNSYSNLDSSTLSELISSYNEYLRDSFHNMVFVSPKFFDKYSRIYKNMMSNDFHNVYGRGLEVSLNSKIDYDVDEYRSSNFLTPESLGNNISNLTFFDANGKAITYSAPTGNEVYVPEQTLTNLVNEAKYSYLSTKAYYLVSEANASHLNPALKEYLSTERENMENTIERLRSNVFNAIDAYPEGFSYEEDLQKVTNFVNTYYVTSKKRDFVTKISFDFFYNFLDVDTRKSMPAKYLNNLDILDHPYDDNTEEEIRNAYEYVNNYNNTHKETLDRAVVYKSLLNVKDYCEYLMSDDELDIIEQFENNKPNSISEELLLKGRKLIDKYLERCPENMYTYILKEYSVTFINSDIEIKTPKIYFKNSQGKSGELTIKGYFSMPNNHMNSLLISKNFLDTYALKESSEYQSFETTDYITPDDAKYNFAITRTSYSQSQVAQLMKDSGSYRYIVKNRAYQKISSFVNLIDSLKTIFIIVGAVVGAFSALLLFNFISVSISNKKRDIGILRAIGARGKDVFKIFYSESFLIAIICVFLALIASIVTCNALNQELAKTLSINALNFGIVNFLIILGAALVVIFIGTFLPVKLAAKKPPVDSIRSL